MGNRIFIVDDHPLVREGLMAWISNTGDLEVCGQAEGADEAIEKIGQLQPDVALIDLSLEQGSGLDLLHQIHARHPEICLLVVSMYEEIRFAEHVKQAGAMGYINKQSATEQIIDAIHAVLKGQFYFNGEATATVQSKATQTDFAATLSRREMQIFELIGKGIKTRSIADELHISIKTVESHCENIKKKLGLGSAHALRLYAMQWVMNQ